jgi:lipid II:glycine glycyltransferase (peptidoglycan interpeptide bridge formation enzyme)
MRTCALENNALVSWSAYVGSAKEWDACITSLRGGFYQTYGWGEVRRSAGWLPCRLLAKSNGVIVAACSVLVRRFGPVALCWCPDGPAGDLGVLELGFRKSLVDLTGASFLYCRISLLRTGSPEEISFLTRIGWKAPKVMMGSGLSMHYDAANSELERLNRTSGNWRHNLKRSRRHNLKVEYWQSPDMDEISRLYREMELLKSLPVQHSHNQLAAISHYCRENMITFSCRDDGGRLLAVRAAGISGLKAMDLLAVAGVEARKMYASHATLWALLNYCSELGINDYDLSGVDPIKNKGVYDFKHGTGAMLVSCVGEWEWASFPLLRFAVNWCISRVIA